MREKEIEVYFCLKVKQLGGYAYKFTSPARRSVPDRMAILPSGRIYFVELKAPGGKPTDAQEREHARLRELGCRVDVLDSKEAVRKWLDEIHPT